MIPLLPAWCAWILLLSPIAVLSSPYVHPQRRNVIYDELVKLNITCDGSCQGNRDSNDLRLVNCHCDSACAQLGTCCVDSKYRMHQKKNGTGPLKCGEVKGSMTPPVFIVEECKSDWNGDDFIKDLCTGKVETLKDPFLYVPVTVLKTGITYRNYFCYTCNSADEGSDPPVFWNLNLMSHPRNNNTTKDVFRDLEMENGTKRIADFLFDDAFSDVVTGHPIFWAYADVPEEFLSDVKWCRWFVWKCAEDWTDVATKDKCEAYTGLVWVQKSYYAQTYRNPHCAICNHEKVSEIKCSAPGVEFSSSGIPPYEYLLSGTLTFENIKKCQRNQVFDTVSRRCRTIRCGRGKKMVFGECVADPLSPKIPKIRPSAETPASTPRQSWLVYGDK